MASVGPAQRRVGHGRHPVGAVGVTVGQQTVVSLGRFAVTVMAVGIGESGPAGVAHGAALRTAPAEVGAVDVVVKQTVRLVAIDDGLHVGPHAARVVRTAVEPNQEQVAVTCAQLRHHSLAQPPVPLLPTAGKLALSLGAEVMDAQQRVPANAYVEAGLHAILAARGHKVGDEVAPAVAPLHRLQAVGVHIALPKTETRFVCRREYGKFCSGGPCGAYPLVSVEPFGVEHIVVVDRCDAVGALAVCLAVKHMQVVVEHHAHLCLVPFQLSWSGNGQGRLCGGFYDGGREHYRQHE